MADLKDKLICAHCGKKPEEIDEYVEGGTDLNITPAQYVIEEEGTLNYENGHFLCTDCYIVAGMPSLPAPGRWVAP